MYVQQLGLGGAQTRVQVPRCAPTVALSLLVGGDSGQRVGVQWHGERVQVTRGIGRDGRAWEAVADV